MRYEISLFDAVVFMLWMYSIISCAVEMQLSTDDIANTDCHI